jgi:hypothetical protein
MDKLEVSLLWVYKQIHTQRSEKENATVRLMTQKYPECFEHRVSQLDLACDLVKRSNTNPIYTRALRDMIAFAIQKAIITKPEGFEVKTNKKGHSRLVTPAVRERELKRAARARAGRGAITKLSSQEKQQLNLPTFPKTLPKNQEYDLYTSLEFSIMEWNLVSSNMEKDHSEEAISRKQRIEVEMADKTATMLSTCPCRRLEEIVCAILKQSSSDLLRKNPSEEVGMPSLDRETQHSTKSPSGSQLMTSPVSHL